MTMSGGIDPVEDAPSTSGAIELQKPEPGLCSRRPLRRRGSFGHRGAIAEMALEFDDRGWSSLHVMAGLGHIEEVRRLLDAGASAQQRSLGPDLPGATPLHVAAAAGHVEIMDLLLEQGADIEGRTKSGWTPLHCAAGRNDRRSIRFLLRSGAFLSPDIADPRFNPPLHYCPGLEYAYRFRRRLADKQEQEERATGGTVFEAV